jgi:hypothetical protein
MEINTHDHAMHDHQMHNAEIKKQEEKALEKEMPMMSRPTQPVVTTGEVSMMETDEMMLPTSTAESTSISAEPMNMAQTISALGEPAAESVKAWEGALEDDVIELGELDGLKQVFQSEQSALKNYIDNSGVDLSDFDLPDFSETVTSFASEDQLSAEVKAALAK